MPNSPPEMYLVVYERNPGTVTSQSYWIHRFQIFDCRDGMTIEWYLRKNGTVYEDRAYDASADGAC